MKKAGDYFFKISTLVLLALLFLLYFQKSPVVLYKNVVHRPPPPPPQQRQPRNTRTIPINIATRGIEDYRQIGILSSNNDRVLPLYGRRTYNGSNRWNYFTQANDHLALKIPLSSNGRDCDTNTGCDELYDNDVIHISQYNTDFTVKLYDNTPRYIPF